MSSHFSLVNKQKDEYIFINNNENILTAEIDNDFMNIYNIPVAPKLPPVSRNIENKINLKIRFSNFSHYKKYLQNKRKRQRRKHNKKCFKF
jgi:hypothetical protein